MIYFASYVIICGLACSTLFFLKRIKVPIEVSFFFGWILVPISFVEAIYLFVRGILCRMT